MSKVNKAMLAQLVADKAGVSKKEAEDMLAAFVQIVISTLQKGDEVTIAGFGAFSAKVRAGRIGVNPQNPSQKIQIPPVTVPKFKAGKALKDSLKGKRGGDDPTTTATSTTSSDVTSDDTTSNYTTQEETSYTEPETPQNEPMM